LQFPALIPYGWNDRWVDPLLEHPGCLPARVVRHDGAGLLIATPDAGIVAAPLVARLEPAPTVGDWIAYEAPATLVAVLPRLSLLRRRSALGESAQALAANVDIVLLVCGLDRPVKKGRIQRGAALALDAGATPVIVLTKAALAQEADAMAAAVAQENPGIELLLTSAKEGTGLDALRVLARDRTVTMLGESGAGKSSLVNALLGAEVAASGPVRAGDSKGRHTTSSRELHVLPAGGVLIDTPGIRAVGLWVEPEAVDATFDDIDDLALRCRFADCGHDSEPSCAVLAAIAEGELAAERLEAWRAFHQEVAATALRAQPQEPNRRGKQFARVTKGAQKRKDR
jgi:ribosome biogenesis GTPase